MQLLGRIQITVVGRCSPQMKVTVCLGPNKHREDGGNVYAATHLCTVPCQTQDIDVGVVSKNPRIKVKRMMQTKCRVHGYLNKAHSFTSSVFFIILMTCPERAQYIQTPNTFPFV